ncbi:MAG: hypothetical protein M3306_19220 [Actinomycetota bacterium]|nr:hypothetical protein [Actinomycetota bacterium]
MTGSRTGFPRSLTAIAVSAFTALVLCSCGGGDEPPGPDASSSPSSPETSESSTAPGGAGGTAEINGATLTAPAGWEVEFEDSSYVLSAPDDDHPTGSGIFNADVTLASDVNELAEAAMPGVKELFPDAKRLKDVTYGGTVFFHLRGSNNTEVYDLYGAVVGDSEAEVAWSFNPEWVTRDEADEFINQVMPTFKFEG